MSDDNDHDPIGTSLGFKHGNAVSGSPCTEGDSGLFFAERYIGVETRRVVKLEVIEGDPVTITLAADAETDETDSTIEQWVECWRCDGAKVIIDPNLEVDYR